MKRNIQINPIFSLAALIASTLALVYITNEYILTINFYERNGQPVSGIPDLESLVYQNIKKVIYLYTVIYTVIKVFTIAMILATGLYFFEIKVRFRDLLQVVILCEFIFLLPAVAKICWFWQERDIVDLITWQNFYFLSASSFVPEIKPAFLLPLQTLNAFELAYWFLLAAGIQKIAKTDFDRALRVVCLSYIPALFTWVIFVVYFTVVYFPQSY
ncbi:MAG: hypothetical protein JST19_12510 [Bacteroidetes bacterium]|nr:hypothetical protein [Bacteroidota bacterium]